MKIKRKFKTEVGKVYLSTTFTKRDIICSKINYDMGLPIFFQATEDDVYNYSNKGKKYYIVII